MDQKRFLVFIVVSMGILIGWNVFVMPRFLPPPKPKVAQKQADRKDDDQQPAEKQDQEGDKGLAAGPAKAAEDCGPGTVWTRVCA